MSNDVPAGLNIVAVHPDDERLFAAWQAANAESARADLGDAATPWTLPELVALMREADDPEQSQWRQGLAAVVGDEVVGTAFVQLPLRDNLDSATILGDVRPGWRRRGIGSALLAHAEQVASSRGRTLLNTASEWPAEYGADGAGWCGAAFAQRHGYALVLSDVQRVLDLPVADDLLTRLAGQAAPAHTGYELHTWIGAVPERFAAGWVSLVAAIDTEAPTGEKEIEPEVIEVSDLRREERTIAEQGRVRYCVVAVAPDGDVVGYTDLVTATHDPGRAYQWGTLVHRDHRGHRLGLALKVANLQQLQARDDSVRRLDTWNAEVNGHMIGVNEQLGFRPVAREGEFQKRLASSGIGATDE